MNCTVIEYKRCKVVKVTGRVDGSTAPQVEAALNGIFETGEHHIVLDMTEVDFMSSAGWWVLIEAQKKCKHLNRGEVVLVNVQEKIRNSLNLVGMDTYFKLYDDLTKAVGSF